VCDRARNLHGHDWLQLQQVRSQADVPRRVWHRGLSSVCCSREKVNRRAAMIHRRDGRNVARSEDHGCACKSDLPRRGPMCHESMEAAPRGTQWLHDPRRENRQEPGHRHGPPPRPRSIGASPPAPTATARNIKPSVGMSHGLAGYHPFWRLLFVGRKSDPYRPNVNEYRRIHGCRLLEAERILKRTPEQPLRGDFSPMKGNAA